MPITALEIEQTKSELTQDGNFFEIEKVSIENRTYRIFKNAPMTINEILTNSRSHGDLEFLVSEGQRYTYRHFFEQADDLAAGLQGHYGIRKGDRVAIAMRNNPMWLLVFTAAQLAGAIVIPINSWGKTEELRYVISDSRASLVVCDQARFELVEHLLPELCTEIMVAAEHDDFTKPDSILTVKDLIVIGDKLSLVPVKTAPKDDALILYTSGSTGFPKGVVHRNIAIGQSLMNMMFLGALVTELEGGSRALRGGAKRETSLLTVPLFHATGLFGGFLLPIILGQKVVMMYKWDALRALQLVEQESITGLNSVPAILQEFFNHPDFSRYNTDSLLRVGVSGAATPAGLPGLISARAKNPSRSTGYGMTETLGTGSTMMGALYDFKPNSAGLLSPIMDVRFMNTEGTPQNPGQPGELELYGICCTRGYWEKPEANKQSFTIDGWLKSGDIGMLDEDNFLHITGRIKELVIRGGENIYPGEIEQAACEVSGIQEVVVFGEPHEIMGEELVMVVYPTPDSQVTLEILHEHLKQKLASYKVPPSIVLSNCPLPRNASEKLDKLKIREQYLSAKASR